MFIFKAGPRKVFRLKPVRGAKKVADPCVTAFRPNSSNFRKTKQFNYVNIFQS